MYEVVCLKRIFVLLLALCLASCDEVQEEKLPAEFDAAVQISADGTLYEAVYEKRADFDRLVFSLPERLSGLDITLRDGITTVTMGDISFESETLGAAFDFLPITGSTVKTVGSREYKIKIENQERGMK